MSSQYTFQDLETVIQSHVESLKSHAFLKQLEGTGTLEQLQQMLPRLAFFTLAFQDVLRLARAHCIDPGYRDVARSLELGDRGHDRWYLEDLTRLGMRVDVDWLFSEHQAISRDVAYGLVSQVTGAAHDSVRLAVLLALEAMAGEFFVRISGFVFRLGLAGDLMYFGVTHLEAEKGHDVFSREGQEFLSKLVIPHAAQGAAVGAVERTFELMTRYADDLARAMTCRDC